MDPVQREVLIDYIDSIKIGKVNRDKLQIYEIIFDQVLVYNRQKYLGMTLRKKVQEFFKREDLLDVPLYIRTSLLNGTSQAIYTYSLNKVFSSRGLPTLSKNCLGWCFRRLSFLNCGLRTESVQWIEEPLLRIWTELNREYRPKHLCGKVITTKIDNYLLGNRLANSVSENPVEVTNFHFSFTIISRGKNQLYGTMTHH